MAVRSDFKSWLKRGRRLGIFICGFFRKSESRTTTYPNSSSSSKFGRKLKQKTFFFFFLILRMKLLPSHEIFSNLPYYIITKSIYVSRDIWRLEYEALNLSQNTYFKMANVWNLKTAWGVSGSSNFISIYVDSYNYWGWEVITVCQIHFHSWCWREGGWGMLVSKCSSGNQMIDIFRWRYRMIKWSQVTDPGYVSISNRYTIWANVTNSELCPPSYDVIKSLDSFPPSANPRNKLWNMFKTISFRVKLNTCFGSSSFWRHQ